MKKMIVAITLVLLIIVIVFAVCKNKDDILTVCLKAKTRIMKIVNRATFKKLSEESLSDGMIKSTFQTTDKVGADIEISIISRDNMVLGSMRKEGDKTFAVFRPSKK